MPWGRSGSALLLLSGRTISRAKARNPSPTEMSVEPWASPQDQAAAEHTDRTHTPPSQDQEQHPDKLCLDSFWSEVETIRQGSGYTDLDCTRRDSRQSEEGEQEEQWLADAGLSNLINEDCEDVDNAVLLSTLTRTQAEAVQRRLDSYTLSLRKRNKPAPRDVRDVFTSPITKTQHSEDLAQNSMASVAKTPLSGCVSRSAMTPEHQRGAAKEEFFITDVSYCEQAVIFLKQAKLPQNNSQRRKEDGTLPRVICPKCRLGVTRIQDLSHTDMKKVRQLALIDMTALCDLLELEVKRHKTSKRKTPDSPLFGVPLATQLENDQKIKPNTTTPLFLQALLQQNLEANFYSGQVSWDEVSPNDAAALLKKFIRELPAPLLTAEYLNTFSAALLEFLSKVISREKRNRMNLWAVATIMAPNLFLHKAVPSRLTEGAEKGHAEKAADVMRLLIRYQDLLWTLCRTVKIQVGDLVSSTMEYQLTVNSRASDLLAQFQRQSVRSPENGKGKMRRNGSVAYPDCALYEVGGNIGEHCLDPDTHLLDLYNSNHGGEWVIKLRPNASRVL
ncbi:Rho GTPase-activating protein 40 [Collichthys lucidus]|uniref:Rho GTPase-activating protein 40 n=1 Tax=Collichthys lucidus TaxID=240159 RepID=A0A4U5U9R4_COLLU|nr:Rho GTPase-activating protein 40 [Collichthys lucidus]